MPPEHTSHPTVVDNQLMVQIMTSEAYVMSIVIPHIEHCWLGVDKSQLVV
ncbi:uncharacterized protein LACBIDRAFT_312532 [Laccaria bicolor S238N-H82]|uniref:Predicted protein n=1 Tax=Laccaria bicolor (strain S238N-H82 / ATCC MYA-4686) TaxID=486041 RepID=B0E4Z4_LACBS|nr:uncharacterized protein LACBIDRAFT_312532 [Laccaria bicolor S238N-H82]EDQ98087.1 predicted protein [Laccaria bicolor S238N-H82]|eukprot:XP_001891262.1 predicted protein [Laccaria bicolor S238N-H82]